MLQTNPGRFTPSQRNLWILSYPKHGSHVTRQTLTTHRSHPDPRLPAHGADTGAIAANIASSEPRQICHNCQNLTQQPAISTLKNARFNHWRSSRGVAPPPLPQTHMKTATLINGKVKFKAGTPKDFGNGERINIVVSADGKDIKVWGNPSDPIAYLQKGQDVTLAYDDKNYILIGTADQPTNGNGHTSPEVQAMATPVAHPAKPALNADVKEWVAIFEEIKAALPQAQESTWRAAASTLFIQRCKSGD